MPFRENPLTGEPVLFAPHRAKRPLAFEHCPFCPGQEAETPPELARDGDPWRVRVFPNKYPPVAGAEVIVESPRHEATFDEIEHAPEVLRIYAERYRLHADAAYVALFRNEGARAGATIAHTHSQLVPLPFVPPRIAHELLGFAPGCPLCSGAGEEIRSTTSFLWLAPHASAFAYQQWIAPRRHVANMAMLTDAELVELAALLRAAAKATHGIAPAYNWMFMNFPSESAGHFYIDIVPRTAVIAGLELGTGVFVEIVDPLAAAARLRA